jgi:putative transposase
MARRWDLGQDGQGLARTHARGRGARAHPQCRVPRPSIGQDHRDGGAERGDDGGKKIKGRKRHLLVDTLGWLLAVLITSAGLDDGVAAPLLLSHVTPQAWPRLITIFADQTYHNHALDTWMAEHRTGWRIAVKARPAGTRGFAPLETRWVIERTNAWHGRYRRNSKDYERTIESSAVMIQSSHIHLMLNRLSPCDRPAFHYRKEAA